MRAMADRVALTEGSWGALFDFLDPQRGERPASDRDSAAEARCLEMMRKLVCFFAGRGCREAEDLAVETILRVAARCSTLDVADAAAPIAYFYGTARHVLHEWLRDELRANTARLTLKRELLRQPPTGPRVWADRERVARGLDRCLARLTGRTRQLVLSYYTAERRAKIEHHRALADEFGKSLNALRIEVHRIRRVLRACLLERLGAEEPGRNVLEAGDRSR